MDQYGSDILMGSDGDVPEYNEKEDHVAIVSPDHDVDSMADDPEHSADPAQPVATDHEAMKERFMPAYPELETEAETVFTWDITGWRQQPKRTHSPVFHCAGHPWRVLFFPAGNAASESVSFYLEQGFQEKKPPDDWYACAQFMLVLQSPSNPTIYIHHEANHRFTAEEGDWGFTRFVDKNRIFAPKFDTADGPLIENDCARMTAYVRVLKDPTGVLWHNFVNYDSKKETGMVGLRNQGATCYLNSLLQSLYLTGAFRQAVYQIPTATDQDRSNAESAYALQRLFYRLQADPVAISTTELTHSFGWESRQVFEQQDVQELSRILMEKLETRMKGTEAENALPNMFVGKMKTYLRCINVEYESSRIEDFWDLQLNVSGCKSVDDSFRDYIQVETLEGDNKYAAEGYGLQDAKKGVIFESFPNVLHLQLKRFEYDFQRDAMMKVNDRYEFPEVWDATPYLDETADKSEPYIYHLHGVLVHSGDLNAGHYYAFLKPEKNGQFFRFDDDRVTRATKREAIDENFGGDYQLNGRVEKGQNPYTRQWSTKRSNNAYMLVYMRESKLDQILPPESELAPPQHLPLRLAEERTAAEKRRKEREEAHLYMNVQVATEQNFKAYQGVDLIPWADIGADEQVEPAAPKGYRLLRSMTIADFTIYIAKQNDSDPELLRPWIMVNRQNGTVRPDHPLLWKEMTLQEAADKFSTRNGGFRIFIEETDRKADGTPSWPSDENVGPSSPNGTIAQADRKPIMIFLKHFDVDRQVLQGMGHIYMSPYDKAQDLAPHILRLMGWEEGVQLELYEEIKQTYIERMKPKNTLIASEIQDGDIICFQRHLSEAEASEVKRSNPAASVDATQYYDFLVNRMFVTFTPKVAMPATLQLRGEGADRFTIPLSKKDGYDALAHKVAEHLSSVSASGPVDPSHLRFTTATLQSGKPRTVIKRQAGLNMNGILLGNTTGYGGYNYTPAQAPDQLYYEVLEMSLTDLEQRKLVRITWLPEGVVREDPHDVLVHKQASLSDLVAALAKRAALPDELLDHIRLYETHAHRISKLLQPTQSLLTLTDTSSTTPPHVFAERLPLEEENLNKEAGERVVYCFHFEKEVGKGHGVPFCFVLREGERFTETKERLSRRTGIKGKNLEKVRFAVVRGAGGYGGGRVVWIEEDDVLSEKMGADDQLGLEHPNRNRGGWGVKYESLNIR